MQAVLLYCPKQLFELNMENNALKPIEFNGF